MEIKAVMFKESGKYYTEENIRLPDGMDQVFEIVDWLRSNYKSYKGMNLVAMLDELPTGYPIMIPACQRM